VDPDLAAYLDRVVDRLRGLEAVWLAGSAATGAYVKGVSDVDVIGMADAPLAQSERDAIAADLSHEQLPCPARKLELTIYAGAQIQLNLNTGAGEHSTKIAEPFWFVLDRAMAREHAVALFGPDPAEVLGEVPRPVVIKALREALDWYAREEPATRSAVLNACRALRFAEEGVFSTKPEAGEWARERVPGPAVVDAALALHRGVAHAPPARAGVANLFIAVSRHLT
jgi:hypothetical protein